MGDVQPWMTEAYISGCFAPLPVSSVTFSASGDHAAVELSSASVAARAVESLIDGCICNRNDGQYLRVSWESTDTESSWGNRKSNGKGAKDKGKGGKDKGDGKGEKGEKKGKKGDGKNGKGAEADSGKGKNREKGDKERGERGRRGGKDKEGRDPGLNDVSWAYIDPKGELQAGFSMEDMRSWFDSGYFEGDMQIALVKSPPGENSKPPPRREFHELRKWFRDQHTAFQY